MRKRNDGRTVPTSTDKRRIHNALYACADVSVERRTIRCERIADAYRKASAILHLYTGFKVSRKFVEGSAALPCSDAAVPDRWYGCAETIPAGTSSRDSHHVVARVASGLSPIQPRSNDKRAVRRNESGRTRFGIPFKVRPQVCQGRLVGPIYLVAREVERVLEHKWLPAKLFLREVTVDC